MKKLTVKQELFCNEYLIDHNGTAAAIRAGYSPKSARTQASENLLNPNIIAAISNLTKITAESLKITRENQIKNLENIKETSILKVDMKPALIAIIEQNKMLGFDKPEPNNLTKPNISDLTKITAESQIKDLERIKEISIICGDMKSAISATREQNKMLGI